MAKLTAWVVTVIGLLLLLQQAKILDSVTQYNGWLIALGVLVIGVGKLMRNYNQKGKR
jgi:hypothetical protein